MILTVTLNAAVDKTYRIPGFSLDRVHRPLEVRQAAGGKGINVARVYRRLGGLASATGFLAGHNGRYVARAVASEGIYGRFVWVAGESRLCLAMVDPVDRTQTEVNEPGPEISPGAVRRLLSLLKSLLAEVHPEVVCLSGSAPPGVGPGVFADIVGLVQSLGVRCALDASGDALLAGVERKPWLVKPNVHELSSICRMSEVTRESVVDAARSLVSGGIEIVAATMGSDGAALVRRSSELVASAPHVDFVSAVGSGDAFLAGLLFGMLDGRSDDAAFALAVGAGAANAAVYGAGFCSAESILELADRVSVQCTALRGSCGRG